MENELKRYVRENLASETFGVSNYESIDIRSLAAGCYNINYLVRINGMPFVFRVSVHSDGVEGNNLDKEFDILSRLQGLHSPKAFMLDTQFRYPFLVEEYLQAGRITRLTGQNVQGIAQALARIHLLDVSEGEKPSLTKEFIQKMEEKFSSIAQDEEMRDELSPYLEWAKEYCKNHEERFAQLSERRLLHGDMHCGNIFTDNGNIIFIDWENTKVSDPVFDIIAFFYESENLQYFDTAHSITEHQKRVFTDAYLKVNNDRHLDAKLDIVYPLRWVSDTFWIASRIADYESIPDELKDKPKEQYREFYNYNLHVIRKLCT